MAAREAACLCGQLRLEVEGDPWIVSICHCLACQRRTGSAFGIQARFPAERVQISGRAKEYVRLSDAGEERAFSFCPECGATVFYTTPDAPHLVAVPVGAFADPAFPAPRVSVHEARMHAWVTLPPDVERDHWAPLQALYEAGRYAEAAAAFQRATELQPDNSRPFQLLGTAYSMIGDDDHAVANYRRAIEIAPDSRAYSGLGTTYYRQGRFAEAVQPFEEAERLDPSSPIKYRNLGDVYARLGRKEAAREAYGRALERSESLARDRFPLELSCGHRVGP